MKRIDGGSFSLDGQKIRLGFDDAEPGKYHVGYELRGMQSVTLSRLDISTEAASNDGRVSGFVRIIGAESVVIEDVSFQGACNRAWLDLRHCKHVKISNVTQDGRGSFGGPILSCKAGDLTGSSADRPYAKSPAFWSFDRIDARNIRGTPPMLGQSNLDLILLHSPATCTLQNYTVTGVDPSGFDSSLDLGWKSNDATYADGRLIVRNMQLIQAPRIKITGRAQAESDRHKVKFLDCYLEDTRIETYYGDSTDVVVDDVEFYSRKATESPIKLGTGENEQEGSLSLEKYSYNGSLPLIQKVNSSALVTGV